MIAKHGRACRLTAAFVAVVATYFITAKCVQGYGGLGAALVAPVFLFAWWRLLGAPDVESRAWWLGFAMTVGLAFPLCPPINRIVPSAAWRLSEQTRLAPWDVFEATGIFVNVLAPFVIIVAAGIAAGYVARRLVRRWGGAAARIDASESGWQFGLRSLLVLFVAMGILMAWNLAALKDWSGQERIKQEQFLARFQASFTSGEVTLLATPRIREQQRTVLLERGLAFRAPEVNEYRIEAPVRIHGQAMWAVYCYTCNDASQDYIYQFAQATAPSVSQLPEFPHPLKPYIEGTWRLIDGVPSTVGARATIVSPLAPVPAGQPVTLVAAAPPGARCELTVYPLDAVTIQGVSKKRNSRRGVDWTWTLQPSRVGDHVLIEIKCIEMRGAAQFESVARGNIQFVSRPAN